MTSHHVGRSRKVRYACFAVIAALYVISVPWYRAEDAPLVYWFGLPDWAAVALLCYVGVALVNAIAWLATDVPDEIPTPDAQETSSGPGRDAS